MEKKLKSKEKNLNKKGEKEKSHKWSKKPSKTVVKSAEETIIFGVPLYLAVERNPSHDGVMLPAIVRECIDYISEYGKFEFFHHRFIVFEHLIFALFIN